jgi:hypothetical protein
MCLWFKDALSMLYYDLYDDDMSVVQAFREGSTKARSHLIGASAAVIIGKCGSCFNVMHIFKI